MSVLTETIGSTKYVTRYAYDKDSRVTDITMAGTRGVAYTYPRAVSLQEATIAQYWHKEVIT